MFKFFIFALVAAVLFAKPMENEQGKLPGKLPAPMSCSEVYCDLVECVACGGGFCTTLGDCSCYVHGTQNCPGKLVLCGAEPTVAPIRRCLRPAKCSFSFYLQIYSACRCCSPQPVHL